MAGWERLAMPAGQDASPVQPVSVIPAFGKVSHWRYTGRVRTPDWGEASVGKRSFCAMSENLAELAVQAEEFIARKLPILKSLKLI
jgi:hypothetical protein